MTPLATQSGSPTTEGMSTQISAIAYRKSPGPATAQAASG